MSDIDAATTFVAAISSATAAPVVLNTLDIFKEARRILVKQGAWMQQFFAADVNGKLVEFDSLDAVCFCATGALYRVTNHLLAGKGVFQDYVVGNAMVAEALDAYAAGVLPVKGHGGLVRWNDVPERTQKEVIDLMDQVIAGLSSEGVA